MPAIPEAGEVRICRLGGRRGPWARFSDLPGSSGSVVDEQRREPESDVVREHTGSSAASRRAVESVATDDLRARRLASEHGRPDRRDRRGRQRPDPLESRVKDRTELDRDGSATDDRLATKQHQPSAGSDETAGRDPVGDREIGTGRRRVLGGNQSPGRADAASLQFPARHDDRVADADGGTATDRGGHHARRPRRADHGAVGLDAKRLDGRIIEASGAADDHDLGGTVQFARELDEGGVAALARDSKRCRPCVARRIEHGAAASVHHEHSTVGEEAGGVAVEARVDSIGERRRHRVSRRGVPWVEALGGAKMPHVVGKSAIPAADDEHRAVGQRDRTRLGAGLEQ